MSPILKTLILAGAVYFLVRRLLKPFRLYQKQVRQRGNSQQNQQGKNTQNKTDDLGDFIDYEEIE